MSIDPVLGILLGLAGWVAVGLLGAWFAGLFAPQESKPTHVPAE